MKNNPHKQFAGECGGYRRVNFFYGINKSLRSLNILVAVAPDKLHLEVA